MTENYTALYEQHKIAGASFTDFGGWQMPLKYSSELAEHHAVRNAAGLFDLSHMGEVWVTGPDAAAFLDYALAGKLSAVAVGKAKYSLICQEDGGIIDDHTRGLGAGLHGRAEDVIDDGEQTDRHVRFSRGSGMRRMYTAGQR